MFTNNIISIAVFAAGMVLSFNTIAAEGDSQNAEPDQQTKTTSTFDEFLDNEQPLGGKFSTWVEFASDYVFRGTSETTDGKIPSIKAAITWTHNSGVYAGLYIANNLFPQPVTATNPEGDIQDINEIYGPYLGYAKSDILGTGLNFNGMLFQYIYPGGEQFNYLEMFNYLDKQFGIWNVKLEYSPTITDWFGVKGIDSHNFAITPSVDLPHGFKLAGTLGHNYFSSSARTDYNGDGSEDLGWTHWNLTLSRKVFGFNVDLSYHDTNIKTGRHDLYGRPDQKSSIDSRYVIAVSKSF